MYAADWCACAVYQLGPRSWKPDASLSQSVSETDIAQTCKLSHDVLMSENPPSTDDADQASSSALNQFNSSKSGPADLPSTHRSKLTWSASGGLKQAVADDDDFE